MDTQKNVIVSIGVQPPKGDGFKTLAKDATEASKVVKQRMDEVQKKMNDAAKGPAGGWGKGFSQVAKGAASQIGGSLTGRLGMGGIGGQIGGELVGGLGMMGFAGTAAAAAGIGLTMESISAVRNPDEYLKRLREGGGPLGIGSVLGMFGAFDGLDASDNAVKRAQQRRMAYIQSQADVLQDTSIRDPISARQRLMGNEQERLGLRARMAGKSEADVGAAEASLAKEQAERRIIDLRRQMSQLTEKDAAKQLLLSRQMVEAQDELLKAEFKKLDAIKQQNIAARERMEKERDHAKDVAATYRDVAQSEMDRLNSAKEQFGLLDPTKQAAIAQVGRKLMQPGAMLSQEEIELAGSTDILRDKLANYGRRRADELGIFEPLAESVGANSDLQNAWKNFVKFDDLQIKLTNDIAIKVSQDEAMQQQLVNALAPVFLQMQQQLEQKLKQELRMSDMAKNAMPKG